MSAITSAVTPVASTTDAASVVTSSFTPAAGDLLILMVGLTGVLSLANKMVITKSIAAGAGFIAIGEVNFDTDKTIALFAGGGLEVPTARTLTINFGVTATGNFWQVYRASGMQRVGQSAIRQWGVQQGAGAATPTVTFPVAPLTGNPLVGMVQNGSNPAAMTPPAGFTETFDGGHGTPTTGYETCFASNGITANPIAWGSTGGSNYGCLIAELDTRPWTSEDVPRGDFGWGGAF